jgi:phosphate transport system permease protein
MPAQIFSWWEMPQRAFEERAALAILLLLFVLFLLNGLALVIRIRSEKRW